jgi:membrane protease YdiL (CAAX protease family)
MTPEHFICLAGLACLATWLLRTSLGRYALANAAPRRNNMPLYLPFIPLFVWIGAISALKAATSIFTQEDRQNILLDQLITCIAAIAAIAVIIFLARASFARRLRGFGLSVKTIHRDLLAAFVNLLSIWPLLLVMIILTAFFGRLIWGQQYTIQPHEELELIKTNTRLSLRILIIFTAVVIAPLVEEMLFRGLFQTVIRSYLEFRILSLDFRSSPVWVSIAVSSIIFTTTHANKAHWPALFVLAVCLGYAYEKSGSLFRPIFIHALFNGITIAAALNQ